MKIQLITTFLIFTLFSCSTSEPQLISVSDIYQIEVPGDMSPRNDLNEEASLAYANLFKEKYLIIIHEEKYEFMEVMKIMKNEVLEEFTKIIAKGYEESFSSVANVSDLSFNGLIGKKIEISGNFEGIPLVWHTVLIEGEDYLYQICFWTLKNREKHMEQLFNSAKTFNEL